MDIACRRTVEIRAPTVAGTEVRPFDTSQRDRNRFFQAHASVERAAAVGSRDVLETAEADSGAPWRRTRGRSPGKAACAVARKE